MQNINNKKIPIRRDENASNAHMRNTGKLLGEDGAGAVQSEGFVCVFRDFPVILY